MHSRESPVTASATDAPRSRGRRLLRFGVRLTGVVISILVCTMAWLEWKGIPESWLARIEQTLAAFELYADLSAARYQFPASVVFEGVRLYEFPSDQQPLLEVDRLRLGWSPVGAWRFRGNIGTLYVRGGTVTLRGPSISSARAPFPPPTLSLSNVNLYAAFSTNGFRLGMAEGMAEDIRIRGDAYVESLSRTTTATFSLADFSKTLRTVLSKTTRWTPAVAAARRQITFALPPRLDFSLYWSPAQPQTSHGTFLVLGYGVEFRGTRFDRWNANVLITNGCLDVRALSLVQGATRCFAQGQMILTNGMTAFHAFSTLPPQTWCCFASLTNIPEWPIVLRTNSKSRFELWAGPAPLSRIHQSVSGWLELENTMVRQGEVQRFFAQGARNGDRIKVDYAELLLPQIAFHGKAGLDVPTLSYELSGSLFGDPRAALPWLPEGPADVIREMDASEHLAATGRVAGCFTNFQAFSVEARCWGSNFVFRTVPVNHFEAALHYFNDTLVLRDMRLQRPEGEACGWVAVDFAHERVSFDADSTLHPHAAARILSSQIYDFLSPFHFEGPSRTTARGVVGYDRLDETDLSGTVTAWRAAWDRFLADEIHMDVRAQGRTVLFTNINGKACGGVFNASLKLDQLGSDCSPPRYDLQAAIEQADFNCVVEEVRGITNEPYHGTLSSTVRVSGVIGRGMGKTARGSGRLEIRNGQLFRLPLLGGLSRFLSRIYPDLGFATQTDLDTQFTIAHGAVCSNAIEMEGSVLSIWGSGCCGFNGDLDVVVQVKLLRRGYPAYLVRGVPCPVTKLLEFHLGGTVDDPRWRPQNLPKELFLMFD